MSAVLSLTPEELAEAPRVWRNVTPGVRVKIVDPDWLAVRELQHIADERGETVNEAVASIIREANSLVQGSGKVIVREVAALHGVEPQDVIGPRRTRRLVAARQHSAWEMRRRTRMSTSQIGRVLGGRDHTTIIHAIKYWPAKAAALGIECLPLEGA